MKDWGLAGEKPSFIVVLSTFPHQHENHLRWPSFPASFDFICSSILVIWPNQSHIKEVAGIWKHLYGNSKMVPRYFEQLADWATENVWRFFDTVLLKMCQLTFLFAFDRWFSQETCQSIQCPPPPSVTTDQGYIREVSAISEPLQSSPPTP